MSGATLTRQFFVKLAKCEEGGCAAPIWVQVHGPEEADYLFCEPHGTAFVTKMRAWEKEEAARATAERHEKEAAAASARVLVVDCRAPQPVPAALKTMLHGEAPVIAVHRRLSVDAGGDAYGMCLLCMADHRADFDFTLARADGNPVAIFALCTARMCDLAVKVKRALNEPIL